VSETAPERTTSGGNVFTRKIGPLPMWAWMGILLGVAGVYYMIKSKKSSSSSSTDQSTATNNTPGGVDSSLVPQFVNQTYVNPTPPAAPNVTVNKTIDSNDTNSNNTTTTNQATTGTKPATTTSVKYITYTVHAGDTLQSLAKKYGVTVEQIASAPGNVYVSGEVPGNKKVGQQLGTGAGLKTGMTLHIPQYTTT
jgi:LysM repeat protein